MEKSSPVLDTHVIEQVIQVLKKTPGLCAAYLHGSALSGNRHPESDIDIALLPFPGSNLTSLDRLALAAELEAIVHAPVDLGVLSQSNLVYCKEVICKGERLFTHDRLASDLFAAQALSMYVQLQRQRKEVIDAYAA